MYTSTSLHRLNADRGLSFIQKILWLVFNFKNNRMPSINLDQGLKLKAMTYNDNMIFWSSTDTTSSPARYLSDSFWLSLPWQEIAKELNYSARVMEVGCGNGRYGEILHKCLGNALISYVGIDVKKNQEWSILQQNPKFKFVVGDARSISDIHPKTNFIITQSALEHFEEDLTFFRQVADFVENSENPIVQIHLLPSAACFYTFPWHGVRQYTPRAISKITKLFDANTRKRLYPLGSRECNRVHRRYITYPIILRKGDQREGKKLAYNDELRQAIELDAKSPKLNEVCFYALVLQTRTVNDFTMLNNSHP